MVVVGGRVKALSAKRRNLGLVYRSRLFAFCFSLCFARLLGGRINGELSGCQV